MYMYMHNIHTCTYIHMYIHTYMYIHIHVQTCIYTHVHAYMYIIIDLYTLCPVSPS